MCRLTILVIFLKYSYLNSLDWNKPIIATREDLTADMCHDTKMKMLTSRSLVSVAKVHGNR